MIDVDDDVPDTGAAFTFGKSKFSNDLPGKFWIRDDPILQVACGDEHTAFLTASGRVFSFGCNEWGQLGHGHTNTLVRPSCIKCLKHERATLVACGRSHTLIATDTGHVYGFGANSEGQLGSPNEYTIHTAPVRVQGLEDVAIKMLSAGADHSMALTEKGSVYVWGGGSEGQLGLEKQQYITPTEVKFDCDVMCISAGYYHSAFVTVDGKLYTCGESDCGKLGIAEVNSKKSSMPRHVSGIPGKVVYASCGGSHTVALTADGKAYSFGNGYSGQLGLGDRILEASTPHLVNFLGCDRIARVSCGESHTGFLTDTGRLYTCGDRRHGKLGIIEEEQDDIYCSQYLPTLVTRFQNFQVQQVACGGCHMLVLATRKRNSIPSSTPILRVAKNLKGPERKRNVEPLPPINSSSGGSTLASKKHTESSTSLKYSSRPRLPSITKSPVWYVPLEKVVDGASDQNGDDDEVLSKLEQRCSILEELECADSIRHVDSDVESDVQDGSDLNQTQILNKAGTTVTIIRPFISNDNEHLVQDSEASGKTLADQDAQKNNNDKLPDVNIQPKTADTLTASPVRSGRQGRKNIKNTENKTEGKSQFYDVEGKIGSSAKSSSSTLSKSSKACTVL